MRGCKFTTEESLDRTILMRVRRRAREIVEWGEKKKAAKMLREISAMESGGDDHAAVELEKGDGDVTMPESMMAQAQAQTNEVAAQPVVPPIAAALVPPKAAKSLIPNNEIPPVPAVVQPIAVPKAPPSSKYKPKPQKPKKTGPRIRRTKLQIQAYKAYEAKQSAILSDARKAASLLWYEQTLKKAEGLESMTIEQVLEAIQKEHGVAPSKNTVYRDVKGGRVGEGPKRRGPSLEYFERKRREKLAKSRKDVDGTTAADFEDGVDLAVENTMTDVYDGEDGTMPI
jgi:hypothetical protein